MSKCALGKDGALAFGRVFRKKKKEGVVGGRGGQERKKGGT